MLRQKHPTYKPNAAKGFLEDFGIPIKLPLKFFVTLSYGRLG
jgi:hypothetical protein